MNLLQTLHTHFSPHDLPILCAALQETPALQIALQEEPFLRTAQNHLGKNPLHWTPAALSLLLLEYPRTPAAQAAALTVFPDSDWETRALEAGRRTLQGEPPLEPAVPHAALLALSLQHLARTQGLMAVVRTILAQPVPMPLPLAILFGLLPAPEDLAHNLILNPEAHTLLWQAALSQPISPADQRELFLDWLRPLPAALLPGALNALQSRNTTLAQELRDSLKPALSDLPSTWEQARLFLTMHDLPQEPPAASPEARALAGLRLCQRAEYDQAAALILPDETHPAIQSLQACLCAARGDRPTALHHARRVLDALRTAAPLPHPDLLIALSEVLLSGKDPLAAEYLLAQALTRRPADPQLLIRYVRVCISAGLAAQALEPARLAGVLAPHDPEAHRALAETCEALSRWQDALQIRRSILTFAPQSPADHSALAACALHAGDLALAQQTAAHALTLAPQDGFAHLIMGRVQAALGEHDTACQHYHHATRCLPQHPEAWMALADDALRRGEIPAALETLRTAVQAAPDSPSLCLQLGRVCLQAGIPAQALEALQNAARLLDLPVLDLNDDRDQSVRLTPAVPLSDPMAAVAAALGEALYALQHPAQAARYLRLAYHHTPTDPQVAWRYAAALRSLRRPAEARRILENVLPAHPPFAGLYLEYARAVLEEGHGVQDAVPALETVLQFEASHPEAHALLAEALVVRGDYARAEEHYRIAMRSPLIADPAWQVRLTLGCAHLALAQQQPETAIALLQEAISNHPNHSPLYQALYQAYLMGGLRLEARDLLDRLYPFYAAAPATLVWLGEQAQNLEHPELLSRILQDLQSAPPEDADTTMRWGLMCARSAPKDAVHIFGRLIANPHTDAATLLYAGENLLKNAQPALALTVLQAARQRATAECPANLWYTLSEACRQQDDLAQALEAVAEGLTRHPAAGLLLKQGARLYLQAGKPEDALTYLEAALTHHPKDLEAHTLLLDVSRQRGDLVGAYRHACQVAAALDESLPHTTACQQAHLLAAELACALLDFQAAAQWLPPAHLEDEPLPVLGLRVEIHLMLDEEVAAAQSVQAAMQRFPAQAETLAWQARLLARQGAWEDAALIFRKAQAALPREASPAARRALALTALQQGEGALAVHLLADRTANPARDPWGAVLWLQSAVCQAERRALQNDLCIANDGVQQPDMHEIETLRTALRAFFTGCDLPLPPALCRWERRALWLTLAESMREDDFPPEPDEVAARLMAMRRFDAAFSIEQAMALAGRTQPSALVQLQLACTLEAIGAIPQALAALEQAWKLTGESPWEWRAGAFFVGARLYARLNDLSRGQQALAHALEARPAEPAWQSLGWEIALRMAQPADIVKHGEALRALTGLSAAQMRLLSAAYRQLGNLQAARQCLLENAASHPEDAETWWLLADLYAADEDWEQVARCAERSLQIAESGAALSLRVQAALHLDDGRAARNRAARLTKLQPDDPQAWEMLAQAWEMLARPEEALTALRRAISIHPQAPLEWHTRFLDLSALVEGAAASLQAASLLWARFPDAAGLPQRVVRFALQAGDEAAALRAAQRALQEGLVPDEAGQAFLHAAASRVLFRQGQLDQAVQHLSAATRLSPQDAEAWLLLGQVYMSRRELRRAAEVLEQACRLSPDHPLPYRLLGEVYRELKSYREAERAVRHAAALAPEDLSLQRMLASLTAINIVYG
ncbi:MAG: hypothetical protein Fur0018_16670 [Anaerolineales bacterium]